MYFQYPVFDFLLQSLNNSGSAIFRTRYCDFFFSNVEALVPLDLDQKFEVWQALPGGQG